MLKQAIIIIKLLKMIADVLLINKNFSSLLFSGALSKKTKKPNPVIKKNTSNINNPRVGSVAN